MCSSYLFGLNKDSDPSHHHHHHHHYRHHYQYSRDALITKTLTDIKEFDRPRAEMEVDKFLLDAEAINIYIQFQKMREQDPDFQVPVTEEEEGLFSFRTVVIVYLSYVAFSIGSKKFLDFVAEKSAAGEWQGTNIPFIDDWISNSLTPAVTEAVTNSAPAVDAVVNSDSVQTLMDTAQSLGM